MAGLNKHESNRHAMNENVLIQRTAQWVHADRNHLLLQSLFTKRSVHFIFFS